jgi:hypothetical protein
MRAVPYEANLSRTSSAGTYAAVLLSGDPAPPAKGDNTWTVAANFDKERDGHKPSLDAYTKAAK